LEEFPGSKSNRPYYIEFVSALIVVGEIEYLGSLLVGREFIIEVFLRGE
jgi:hypothetical protein